MKTARCGVRAGMGSVCPLRRAGVMGRHFVGQVRQVGQVGQIWCAAIIQRSPRSPQKAGCLQSEPCACGQAWGRYTVCGGQSSGYARLRPAGYAAARRCLTCLTKLGRRKKQTEPCGLRCCQCGKRGFYGDLRCFRKKPCAGTYRMVQRQSG